MWNVSHRSTERPSGAAPIRRSVKPAIAGFALAAAAAAVAAPAGGSAGAGLVAGAVALAILAVWSTGSAVGANRSARGARWDRWTTTGLAASLVLGVAGAALLSGDGPFGLPRALWALLSGVFLVPLLLTTVGFAAAFEPPSNEDLRRLREAAAPPARGSGRAGDAETGISR